MKHEPGGNVQAAPQIPQNPQEKVTLTWESAPQTKEEALERLQESKELYESYQKLKHTHWKSRFLDFCRGKKSLPLTYDPFFKYIFDPETHRERLERFISSIFKQNVRIRNILPMEGSLVNVESYLIMDLVVELEDGSLCNVEIQKQGYLFPAERVSCYSADLLLRQYTRCKSSDKKNLGYSSMHKVYVIVLFEESQPMFHQYPEDYLHHGKTMFQTGLPFELLQEYYLIALDVFREIPYPEGEKDEQRAWLSLLTTEDLADAEKYIQDYPWLEEIYEEIAMLRNKPEEVLTMWSEALLLMDQNTLKHYVDELKEEVEEKEALIREKDAEIAALKKLLEGQKK